MLHIYFKADDDFDDVLTENNYRIQPTLWFDYQGGSRYITGDLERQIIKSIDDADVLDNQAIKQAYAGVLAPSMLSGTSKTLILANNEPGIYVNGDFVGNNGYSWLIHLAEEKDLYLRAGSIMHFYLDFPAHIINTNNYISTWDEFLDEAVKGLYDRHL